MTIKYFRILLSGSFCFVFSIFIQAQNCAAGFEVTAPAGGTASAAPSLTVFNSTEAGPDSAAARAAVDLQDDGWRAAVLAINPSSVFNIWSDTTTAQGNVSVPQNDAFLISGVNISYDYRDIPIDYRTVTAPCIGSTIAAAGERIAFLAKTDPMQGGENAPRPASLYNALNQPIIYDEIQANLQSGRASSVNAVVLTFSLPLRSFGVWFGDTESRTDGGGSPTAGQPMIVRLLDASGNRIGSDVLLEPNANQSTCGDTAVGCGNQTTRWIGFVDSAIPRVAQMVAITGFQGGTSVTGAQRLSFIGPTIPLGATAAAASIDGRVTTADGRGIKNVRVTLQNLNGAVRTALTGSFGYYEFGDVPVGQTYVLSVTAKRFRFEPNRRTISFLDQLTDLDFISTQ